MFFSSGSRCDLLLCCVASLINYSLHLDITQDVLLLKAAKDHAENQCDYLQQQYCARVHACYSMLITHPVLQGMRGSCSSLGGGGALDSG